MKWISTKDKLPDNRNIVLVFGLIKQNDHARNSQSLGLYIDGEWYMLDYHLTDPDFFKAEVSYWMMMPNEPIKEKK